MKTSLIVLAVVIALASAFVLYGRWVTNPGVMEKLAKHPDGERAGIVMVLGFPDGKRIPVNYLREGNQVFVGADGPWWRAFHPDPTPVTLWIRGQALTGTARVVLDDPDYVSDVFSRLRPTAPDWLPTWLNGRLVVIDVGNVSS